MTLMTCGAVTVSVALSRATAFQEVALNADVAKRWCRLLTRTATELDLHGRPDLSLVVGLPGVLGGDVDQSQLAKGSQQVLAVVDRALDALVEMRAAEGVALATEIERLAHETGRLRALIEERIPTVVAAHHAALVERVALLLGAHGGETRGTGGAAATAGSRSSAAAQLDPADLARELALLADRLDVTEELARLASHQDQLAKLVTSGDAVGRKLDFLVQEFHREANTIGAKVNDAATAHLVVDLKVAIERLREQVQNIE